LQELKYRTSGTHKHFSVTCRKYSLQLTTLTIFPRKGNPCFKGLVRGGPGIWVKSVLGTILFHDHFVDIFFKKESSSPSLYPGLGSFRTCCHWLVVHIPHNSSSWCLSLMNWLTSTGKIIKSRSSNLKNIDKKEVCCLKCLTWEFIKV
jgi:hypothetical protein